MAVIRLQGGSIPPPVRVGGSIATETLQFQSDGVALTGFLAEPSAAPDGAPAILVLHEWWGLTDHIKGIARRCAAQGYIALAPDLYARLGSKVASTVEEAAALMNALSAQAVLRDLNAATRCVAALPVVDPRRIAVMGFSMGGTFALTQAIHNSDLKAAVSFYGKVPPVESLDSLLSPVLYHYPAKDGWVTSQEVALLRQAKEKFGKSIEVCVYPEAAHAFCNETRPDVYRAADAALAWDRTVQFLANRMP